MASEASSSVTKDLHALFRTGTATGLTDGSLLDRFRSGPAEEAEAAFAVLVERHGPMVIHVCRRILGDRHDAEDAAQAVFLVLARQARSIRRTDSVASWLYGVAARVAAPGATRRRPAAACASAEARRRPWRSGTSMTAIGTGRRPGRSSTRSWAGSPIGSGCRSCSATWRA